jgi:ATP-binding cassette, subfamily C (CFTR/MRP), member 1
MRVDGSAQTILKTDSFSGFRKWDGLGYGYLAAEESRRQPLCGSKEGWGPLSPHRYDFTPCFMDACVSLVAVYGILFGVVAVWWLVKRKQKTEIEKDWHFWTKQVGGTVLLACPTGWV